MFDAHLPGVSGQELPLVRDAVEGTLESAFAGSIYEFELQNAI
jgi:hypothetical protein